ncbi:MAG TPA: L-seryl-tRNA(Sec) selenium transferase [Pseudonocardiaceae bacterium]|jgi:L-seryl-tRNA(Ser) seleniumtransferase|nr:L-seryl-tRNA(Sec) selenium transferase [Pseudonocardiaceae bacterium]
MGDLRRDIPRTDAVLGEPAFVTAAAALGPAIVKAAVVDAQRRARLGEIPPQDVPAAALAALPPGAASLHQVINATGVIVHTNLGRAPLSPAAREAVTAAAGYTDVEFDLATGRRATRGRDTLAALAAAVPAAGAVHVVNNNAAALLLCALTLAPDKEILISRGELVEIGDGFRIPDLVTATGARLREVGTTNRTHLRDYAAAVTDRTGFILKVHPSNFRVLGFTSGVDVPDLATLGLPLVVDIGSGLLAPHPLLPDEPDAQTVLAAGATLVTASGDKLLGGPQAGILLGDADLVHRLRRHPAARALRVDKLTLAALEATLRGPRPPVADMLVTPVESLRARAHAIVDRLVEHDVPADVVDCESAVGGGGAPGVAIPSVAVAVAPGLAAVLRQGRPPVVGRVEADRCLLDLRTVEDDDALTAAVLAAVRTPA